MTHTTTHAQSSRTSIALAAAAGLALIVGIALRVDDRPQREPSVDVANLVAAAEWARSEGLSGLSPASLRVPQRFEDEAAGRSQLERTAIADWARTESLSGLSPVSLAPVG
jgi:hypothetical protein